ncbi:hypothetical protein INT43_003951 [Umbelopsis isabellina]|uniref:Uncharacterized protein n=1 Tax=Mortierella isabellina TaxID=91625 RepID=A0A8H7PUL8_MORIS|nr:hypothetical protein INT43_003951 [Umbelopsis isabellina]
MSNSIAGSVDKPAMATEILPKRSSYGSTLAKISTHTSICVFELQAVMKITCTRRPRPYNPKPLPIAAPEVPRLNF